MINIIIEIILIILIEIARIFFINRYKNNKFLIVIITVVLIFLQLNYLELFKSFSNGKRESFEYICKSIIPIISYNILFSYLVLKKIYYFGIAFKIIDKVLYLIFPQIASMSWFLIGTVNVILCFLIYIIFKFGEKKKVPFFQIIVLIFCIILICFMLGIFRYKPISIISNSMVPFFERGDVVIFEKIDNKKPLKIQNGMIIIYKYENKYIAHRVISKIEKDNKIFYETKGDNNISSDSELVSDSQIIGIYNFHIKFIGYPSIWLYEFLN